MIHTGVLTFSSTLSKMLHAALKRLASELWKCRVNSDSTHSLINPLNMTIKTNISLPPVHYLHLMTPITFIFDGHDISHFCVLVLQGGAPSRYHMSTHLSFTFPSPWPILHSGSHWCLSQRRSYTLDAAPVYPQCKMAIYANSGIPIQCNHTNVQMK